ncbi:MAG: lipid-A-disaccharide synthase [Pelagibacteraceae bacterium]
MKKIFILTGESSGDKLASKVIINLKKLDPNIEYLSVGGENLKSIGIKSIYDLKEITYFGFTSVLLNILKIRKKIKETSKAIIEFNPDILLTVDSPDFTLRVSQDVKKKNPKIKTIHYVAPQVWVWRENRVKKIKKFIDHILLLFHFEKIYFDKEEISNEFVGHPLLEFQEDNKIDINQIIGKNNALISIFPGSRKSEINILMPILLDYVKLMKNKYSDILYVFHATKEYRDYIQSFIEKSGLKNCESVCDNNIKSYILKKSIFAISKSGTVSLEICNLKIPSIILYKINFINYIIIKMLVKTKYANIINIAANKEIIPELLQSKCNALNIFNNVKDFLENPNKIKEQVSKTEDIIKKLRTKKPSSELASLSIYKML